MDDNPSSATKNGGNEWEHIWSEDGVEEKGLFSVVIIIKKKYLLYV